MTSGKTSRQQGAASGSAPAQKRKAKPEWADGLRQIYDSVLDEPLPDSFNDLLAKLDDPS
ncbi:NepR family anti-sigma factor [Pontixanthobacter sp. CEM42]|uniref:NepR family anti-sigma factor n=1 Tax=Pontixanthobacter sp. CEM42 TaxID=2792077 RepID=UPI001AE07E73|nr:NepR family anti-sigma factor [Pontixanthobacter sp. CEM42]